MTNRDISKNLMKVLILGIALLLVTILVYQTGGIKHVYSHSMYLVILLAGFWFGLKGGFFTAIFAGVMLGPMMPLDVSTGELQTVINWLYRLIIFIGAGGLWGEIIDYLRSKLNLLKWAGTHDPETGLGTLSLLEDSFLKLKENLPPESEFFLSICSIENYDDIVSTFGLRSGESIMIQFAERTEEFCPEGSEVFQRRMGKLIVLIPTIDGTLEDTIPRRIKQLTTDSYQVDSVPVHLELSVGILKDTIGTEDSVLELVRKATIAQEEAQNLDSEYVIYSPNLKAKPIETIALLGELRQAIDNDELYLEYQAKVDAGDRHLRSVEALIRWKHPRLGKINPCAFIPYAEKSDLINPLTDWVIEEVLQQIKRWQSQGLFTRIGVNISTRNLQSFGFADRLLNTLRYYNVSPESLELEVTEWTFMKNQQSVIETLNKLSRIPIFIAIDDFGTGYSSLQYINRIPGNSIKIDRSFIQQIEEDPGVYQIVRAVVSVGHSLGMEVVAEGVETDMQYHLVQRVQCDAVQGYYIHRPSSPEELFRQFADKGTKKRT